MLVRFCSKFNFGLVFYQPESGCLCRQYAYTPVNVVLVMLYLTSRPSWFPSNHAFNLYQPERGVYVGNMPIWW
jgi:hypothetical protein